MGIILAYNIYIYISLFYTCEEVGLYGKREQIHPPKNSKNMLFAGIETSLSPIQWSDKCNSSEWYNLMLNMNWGGGKHLKTTKHGITSGNIVKEEVEKKTVL